MRVGRDRQSPPDLGCALHTGSSWREAKPGAATRHVTGMRPRMSLGSLLAQADWALSGPNPASPDAKPGARISVADAEMPALAEQTTNGSDGTRTRGLRRDRCVAGDGEIPLTCRDFGALVESPEQADMCVSMRSFAPT
jgi:hypothetical protein